MALQWINKHWLALQRFVVCVMVALVASLVIFVAQRVALGAVADSVVHKATGLASLLVMLWAITVFWLVLTGRLDAKLVQTRQLLRRPELVVDNTK